MRASQRRAKERGRFMSRYTRQRALVIREATLGDLERRLDLLPDSLFPEGLGSPEIITEIQEMSIVYDVDYRTDSKNWAAVLIVLVEGD